MLFAEENLSSTSLNWFYLGLYSVENESMTPSLLVLLSMKSTMYTSRLRSLNAEYELVKRLIMSEMIAFERICSFYHS